MSTIQIVGIAVASAVVVLLIIALSVSRRKGERDDTSALADRRSSFLDEAPLDTLDKLGRPEQPVEDVTLDPGVGRQREAAALDARESTPYAAAPAEEAPAVADARTPMDELAEGGLGLDWGPSAPETLSEPAAPAPSSTPISPLTESGTTAAPEPAEVASGEPAATPVAEMSGSSGRTVPLSDIIVTTSDKMVDLEDAEVRRMLTDLVTFEIDQATQYRQQGQTIDAILQLTEAEKISRALGMQESAEAIHTMMEDLQRHA